MDGVRDGFNIISSELPGHVNVEQDNYTSATVHYRELVEKQIHKELENGHYVKINHKPAIVSALGAIPKKGQPNDIRLIHDASRPHGEALNDFAEYDPFSYQSLQDAIDTLSPGAFMCKVDLKSAYRSVGITPSNFNATGIKWRFQGDTEDTYMIDRRLCFGGRRSPPIFHKLSQAVRAIMKTLGFTRITVFLDDFLVVADNYEDCIHAINVRLWILRKLGFAINYSKLEGPSQRLVFLGILLDTVAQIMLLPQDTISDLSASLVKFASKSKVTKRQVQSLVGKLNFACQCIYGGRTFLRKLLDKMATLRFAHHRTRVTQEMRGDIGWWTTFLSAFNGTMPMLCTRQGTCIELDACNLAGGVHFQGDILYFPWRECWPEVANEHINHLETLILEPAVNLLAHRWEGQRVFVYSDNKCAVAAINRGHSRNHYVNASLRRVWALSLCHNFRITAIYYPGACNRIADRASRLHEYDGMHKLLVALMGR